MANSNALGKSLEQSLAELDQLAVSNEKQRRYTEMMRQLIAAGPPPMFPNMASGPALGPLVQGVQRPATLKEQIESVIAAKKSQIAVFEHLLATLNLGAFKGDPAAEKFYETVVGNALAQMK